MAISLTDFIKQAQAQQPTATAGGYDLSHLKRSPMELLIMQQAMAQKADAKTLAGFALGKLLRGLFDDWKSRYDARGMLNRMAEMDPNARNKMLAFLEQNNPTQHQRMLDYLSKDKEHANWAGLRESLANTPAQQTAANTSASSAPQSEPSVNLNARAVQQAPAKLLGDTNWAQEPWNDKTNWDKWKTLTNVGGWGSGL